MCAMGVCGASGVWGAGGVWDMSASKSACEVDVRSGVPSRRGGSLVCAQKLVVGVGSAPGLDNLCVLLELSLVGALQ